MRYRGGGGGSGSAPRLVCVEDEWWHTHKQKKHKHIAGTHLFHCRVTSPMALFATTLDDMAPEEQDKMPLLAFSDVHHKAKSSLTATFVRCQSDASHTDVQLFFFLICRTAKETIAIHISKSDGKTNGRLKREELKRLLLLRCSNYQSMKRSKTKQKM